MWKISPAQFIAAIVLDLLLGDPRGWPHPARMTGRIANWIESRFRAWAFERSVLSGALLWMFTAAAMLGIYEFFGELCARLHLSVAWVFGVLVVYQCIAISDLKAHVLRVLVPLREGNLPAARHALSQIVGRDTAGLNENEISRGAIECVAESTCDGILAPLFWAAIFGWPGALIYRVANTLDSMIGHRDATYERFGKASARIDDALNWLPARLAAAGYACFGAWQNWRWISREARAHASPNAGWPEAAMAYALEVKLGGENSYGGVFVAGPVFNARARPPIGSDIARSLEFMQRTVIVACGALLPVCGLFYFV